MRATVLVTGFDPFGGEEINASGEVVKRLEDSTFDNAEVSTRILPTDFSRAPRALEDAIRDSAPEVVICLGQARGRSQVTPERVAINAADARRIPDNADRRPLDEPVAADGPAAYWSTLPVREIEATLLACGIPARISNTAGTFVCNQVFYSLMHLLATRRSPTRGGFIHVPVLPEQALEEAAPSMTLALSVRAVELAIEVAVRAALRALKSQ